MGRTMTDAITIAAMIKAMFKDPPKYVSNTGEQTNYSIKTNTLSITTTSVKQE